MTQIKKQKVLDDAFNAIIRLHQPLLNAGAKESTIKLLMELRESLGAEISNMGYIEPLHKVETGNDNSVIINGITISSGVLEDFGYLLVEKDDEISNIEDMYCEAKRSRSDDAHLMKCDIDYLRGLNCKDIYLFSSRSTNEYILYCDNPEKFDELCDELIENTFIAER